MTKSHKRLTVKKVFALLSFMPILLLGCSKSDTSSSIPIKPSAVQQVSSVSHQPKAIAQKEPPVLRLSELWGASKSKIRRALHGHKLVEDDKVPQDDPDPMAAGGEVRVYNLGGGTEFSATFNSQGYATIVYVDNQKEDGNGLGFTLDQWHEAFRRYGLQECGEPAKTAPAAYYWGPPHNHTGGFEIEVIANEKGQVWQVQARSPDDFFPD